MIIGQWNVLVSIGNITNYVTVSSKHKKCTAVQYQYYHCAFLFLTFQMAASPVNVLLTKILIKVGKNYIMV